MRARRDDDRQSIGGLAGLISPSKAGFESWKIKLEVQRLIREAEAEQRRLTTVTPANGERFGPKIQALRQRLQLPSEIFGSIEQAVLVILEGRPVAELEIHCRWLDQRIDEWLDEQAKPR
jgi:hypothetical protein